MTAPRKAGPALKKALPYVLLLDLAAIGGFLALWFTTENPILAALPVALAGPLVAVILFRVAQIDKRALLADTDGPRIVE
jgi:hypothetical protein